MAMLNNQRVILTTIGSQLRWIFFKVPADDTRNIHNTGWKGDTMEKKWFNQQNLGSQQNMLI